jgi:hypothetical protein
MVIQAVGVVSSVLAIGGFLVWLGRLIYQQAAAPKGYAAVLTAVSLLSFMTFAAVLVLFFVK